jgi:hypothetical protein
MLNYDVVKHGMNYLSGAYRETVNTNTVDVYADALSNLSNETFEMAIKYCVQESPFFPKPADILKAAIRLEKLINGVPSAEEAWEDLQKAYAPRMITVYCREHDRLEDMAAGQDPEHYWDHINNLKLHEASCKECHQEVKEYPFLHSLVRDAAMSIGWPNRIDLVNIGITHAQFIKIYQARVDLLAENAKMMSEIKEHVEGQKLLVNSAPGNNKQIANLARTLQDR